MDGSGERERTFLLAYRFSLSLPFSPSPAPPTPSPCLSCPPSLPSLLPLFLNCYYIYYLVCTHGCACIYTHAMVHMWRSENSQEPALCLHHVGFWL